MCSMRSVTSENWRSLSHRNTTYPPSPRTRAYTRTHALLSPPPPFVLFAIRKGSSAPPLTVALHKLTLIEMARPSFAGIVSALSASLRSLDIACASDDKELSEGLASALLRCTQLTQFDLIACHSPLPAACM